MLKMKNTKWLNEELEFLKLNYANNGAAYCAEKLDRSKRGVAQKAKALHLKLEKSTISNILTKHTKEILEDAIKKSECYADVMRNIKIQPHSGNYPHLKKQILKFNIDVSHFKSQGELTKIRIQNSPTKSISNNKKDISEYLINGIRTDNRKIKNKLYEAGIKEKKCEMCGTGEEWYGRKLSLRLDHINGINTDYRLENLRIICPNCDSTLDTYCSKNRKLSQSDREKMFSNERRELKHIRKCIFCTSEYESNSKKQKYCSHTCHKLSLRKCTRPTYEELIDNINEFGYVGAGKKHGVSDNAIRKWIKQYEKQASVGQWSTPTDS
jgi:hypothetical protein